LRGRGRGAHRRCRPRGVGLYYVEETATPAGYVGAQPFLVALPLTDPSASDARLDTVHVYPKNARVSIALDVIDERAVKAGDAVAWLARADIPRATGRGGAAVDGYRIVQRLDPQLELLGTGGASGAQGAFEVRLSCAGGSGCPTLDPGIHWTVDLDPAGRTAAIDFTPAGLWLLERAADSDGDAAVEVGYRTRVLGEGELVNEASLFASRAIIADGAGSAVSDTAITKFGPLGILVHERGKPQNLIPGAGFKLYLSAEDAAAGRNAVEVDGVDEWTTDADGRITIHGLRLSDFVNGLDREESDPLYRYYYVILTRIPPGYIGEQKPLAVVVTSTVEPRIALVELRRGGGGADPDAGANGGSDSGADGTPRDGLTVTGGQIAGAAMLGAMLLVGGAAVLLRRRGERESPAP
ncbi:MAG: SpaH/EbpB family LPXTG-anchored major pilin, partial [Leucobacter sp.]